uniref:Peptidase_M3 domain-containing protein n=1 Tax=Angiostrongylus cantonensis TaxID=6313 RepID=A0A0K0D4A9_ANGCA
MVEARVDLLSSVVNVEEIDVTGKFRKLRPALDEDVAWMADSEYVFSRYKEDVRGVCRNLIVYVYLSGYYFINSLIAREVHVHLS